MMNGTMYAYYFICKRKLWLFSKQVSFEKYNEDVRVGKLIDETYYNSKQKGIPIDADNRIDFIDEKYCLHEVKKSKRIEKAHIAQAKYYAYTIVKKGGRIDNIVINYPTLNQKETYAFSKEDYDEVEKVLGIIMNTIELKKAPPKWPKPKKICMSCAYYEFCYI